MKAKHVFSSHIYLISSHSVARNPLFPDQTQCMRFLEKLDFYLSPLCEILQYSLNQHEFQLIIRLHNREKFCEYYREKYEDKALEDKDIPITSHIFSQAMANFLASTAIHFNRRFKRTGALFARRFYRSLVTSKRELLFHLNRLSKMENLLTYTGKWKVRGRSENSRKWKRRMKKKLERNGYMIYKKKQKKHPILSSFRVCYEIDLQGQFKNLSNLQITLDFLNKSSTFLSKIKSWPP